GIPRLERVVVPERRVEGFGAVALAQRHHEPDFRRDAEVPAVVRYGPQADVDAAVHVVRAGFDAEERPRAARLSQVRVPRREYRVRVDVAELKAGEIDRRER